MNTNTSLQHITALTVPQQQAVLALTRLCQKQDGISLSYPLLPEEGASDHFLLWDETDLLVSALSLCPLDESTLECMAFTHPDHRQRGYFSRLLALALKDSEEYDLIFPVSGCFAPALAALEHSGAELFQQEFLMERNLSLPLPPAPKACRGLCLLAPERLFSEGALWQLAASPSDRQIIGSCLTSPGSEDALCLHQVEISPRLRGKGLGTALIWKMLDFLQKNGSFQKLLLHVSGSNLPAISLYKKTGFRITETLSYYLL